jgi:hypothetical protein
MDDQPMHMSSPSAMACRQIWATHRRDDAPIGQTYESAAGA